MKRFFLFAAFLLFLGLYVNTSAQVESGTFFFNGDTKGYTLNQNEGKRTMDVEINFNKPFDKKPKVVLSTTLIDKNNDTKLRYSLEATGVSRDGFIIRVSVWGDTKLDGIGGMWVAHIEE